MVHVLGGCPVLRYLIRLELAAGQNRVWHEAEQPCAAQGADLSC